MAHGHGHSNQHRYTEHHVQFRSRKIITGIEKIKILSNEMETIIESLISHCECARVCGSGCKLLLFNFIHLVLTEAHLWAIKCTRVHASARDTLFG